MIRFVPLLADAEWFKLAAFGVAFVIYVINHLVSAARKAQQRQAARPPVAAEQPASPARQQLNDELTDFLRKAGDKRQNAPPQPRPANYRSQARKQKKQTPPVLEAQVVEEPLSKRKVKSTLAARSLDQRTQSLAHLPHVESRLEQQIQQKFTHKVGHLAGATEPVAAPIPAATHASASPGAARLLQVLANPQNVRDAIVLGEILQRPEHRW